MQRRQPSLSCVGRVQVQAQVQVQVQVPVSGLVPVPVQVLAPHECVQGVVVQASRQRLWQSTDSRAGQVPVDGQAGPTSLLPLLRRLLLQLGYHPLPKRQRRRSRWCVLVLVGVLVAPAASWIAMMRTACWGSLSCCEACRTSCRLRRH